MYNLAMHTNLPVQGAPWQWVAKWSTLLEEDLEKRRLEARAAASGRNKRTIR